MTSPAATVAVAHDALGLFFNDMLTEFNSTGVSLALTDIPGFLNQDSGVPSDSDGTILTNVDLTGGQLTGLTFAITTVAPTVAGGTDGTFTVSGTVAGHVNFTSWAETYLISGMFDTTTDDLGAFTFDITLLPLTLTVAFAMSGTGADPDDVSDALSVTITEGSAGTPQLANVSVPDRSLAAGGSGFLGWLAGGDRGVEAVTAALGATTAVPAGFVAALNTMFATIPDSGKVTSDLAFLFPPTELAFPATGGFQMGVSGRLETAAGVRYPGPDPTPVALPAVPASGMSIAVNDYLVSEAAWYASQAGTLNLALPPDGAAPGSWTTDAVRSVAPELWTLAPSAPISVSLLNAPTAPPVAAFQTLWQVSAAVLTSVNAPASVVTALTPYAAQAYVSSTALLSMLNAELTAADFAPWSAPLVAAAASNALGLDATYQVRVSVPVQGAAAAVIGAALTLRHQVTTLALAPSSAGAKQALTFSVQRLTDELTDVTFAAGFTMPAAHVQALYSALIAPQLDTLTAALQSVGAQGVALPSLTGFALSDACLQMGTDQILITGQLQAS